MPVELQYRRVNWKYVLEKDAHLMLPVKLPGKAARSYVGPYLLFDAPLLLIKAGYAWDGASGAWDTKATMYPALVHDALYQLIRLGIIPSGARKEADKLFRRLLKAEGMKFLQRWCFYRAVRWLGASAARPK